MVWDILVNLTVILYDGQLEGIYCFRQEKVEAENKEQNQILFILLCLKPVT